MEYTNTFTCNFLSDEEIVKNLNYKFSLDKETLLNNSSTTRRAERFQRGDKGHPKCQNAFFLYRRDKMASHEFKNRPPKEKRAPNVSKEISELWKKEPEEVRSGFHALARLAEERHSENYGQNTENELESEKQLSTSHIHNNNFIDQASIERQFQYIQDNNIRYYMVDRYKNEIYFFNLEEQEQVNCYPPGSETAQLAHDYTHEPFEDETVRQTHDYGHYYTPGGETAQQNYPFRDEIARQTHDYGHYYTPGDEIARQTHEAYYYTLRDETARQTHEAYYYTPRDETAQQTHDYGDEAHYYAPEDETARQTHDYGDEATYYASEDETARQTHDYGDEAYYHMLGDEQVQKTYHYLAFKAFISPFGDETARQTHDYGDEANYYTPKDETARQTHDYEDVAYYNTPGDGQTYYYPGF